MGIDCEKILITVPVLAAFALTGCSADNQSADAKPSATVTHSASDTVAPAISPASPSVAETKKVDPGQSWADDMINLFLNGNSKSSFEDFNKKLPHHYIEAWTQESEGVMSVTVSGSKWSQCEMDGLAVTVMSTAGHETPGMKKVVTHSDKPGLIGSTGRDGMNFGTPESC